MVQKCEATKINKLSKETILYLTFLCYFLLFAFKLRAAKILIYAIGLHIANRKYKTDRMLIYHSCAVRFAAVFIAIMFDAYPLHVLLLIASLLKQTFSFRLVS